jgi:hypothetical protein
LANDELLEEYGVLFMGDPLKRKRHIPSFLFASHSWMESDRIVRSGAAILGQGQRLLRMLEQGNLTNPEFLKMWNAYTSPGLLIFTFK